MAADLDLSYKSAAALRELYLAGSTSAIEVVKNTLARIDETNPDLNALTHVDAAGALEAARACDVQIANSRSTGAELPPLCGIPVTVKELIEVGGMPCRYGSRTMADHIPAQDAPSVARLRAAGAIIVGMTNTAEYGYRGYTDNLLNGLTRNPWDLGRSPGGSSGGAVSSVAAGVTPIALGTDGGGSIRNPCGFTGLVGIKAQFGRVPIYPASATPTLAHVGPIARNAEDAARLLHVIAGPDRRDWTSLQALIGKGAGLTKTRPVRIAYSPTFGYGKIDSEVAQVLNKAIETLQLNFGPIAIEEKICHDESELFMAEFIGGCSARLGTMVEERPYDIDPMLLKLVLAFREGSAPRYTELLQRRYTLREEMRQVFKRWDVLLSPMTPSTALRIGQRAPEGYENYRLWTFFAYPFNLTGQPAATLPCGFSSSGLPIGLQIIVPPQREALLIELLRHFEQVLCCNERRPPIA
jgi:aspartyl-tRNA(Asn)/glutamyl-tRNA(Gln) amidotransferase subunit A